MGKHVFLSYATDNFKEARDLLCESALRVGFDKAIACTYEDLSEEFRLRNYEILSQVRGAGYWLWKPQIIIQELEKLDKDDVLVYSDAGRSSYYQFKFFPKNCIAETKKHGFLLGPTIEQHGPMSKWTKRDAFVLLDMDNPEIYKLPPIQATYSFWSPTEEAFSFLNEWKKYCEDSRVLTDIPNTQGLPNLNDFTDHRHDQSVLSLLAYKNKAKYINNNLFFKILNLRSKSKFSNVFLKRIDDVNYKTSFGAIFCIFFALYDIYWCKK